MPALQEGEQHQCVRSRPSAPPTRRQTDPRALRADFDDSFKRSSAAYTLDDADEQRWATLAVLECRGCEIIEFDPQGTWACKGAESNTPFDEVELSKDEADWNDYDEKVRSLSPSPSSLLFAGARAHDLLRSQAGEGVSIMDLETRIQRA